MLDLFTYLGLFLYTLLASGMVGLMGTPCCCGCNYFTDTFATDNLATDYTAISGSWSVATGKLTTTSSNAVLVVNATALSDYHVASVDVTLASNTDEARIIMGYTDSNNYLFLQLVQDATWGTTAQLVERAGGVEIKRSAIRWLLGYSAGSPVSWTICCGPDGISGRPTGGGTDTYVSDIRILSTGNQIGLGTGPVAGSVSFDNLIFSKHSSDDSSCTSCVQSTCGGDSAGLEGKCIDGTQMFTSLQIVVSGVTNGTCGACAGLNGTYILTQDVNPLAYYSCQYNLNGFGPVCTMTAVTFHVSKQLFALGSLSWVGTPLTVAGDCRQFAGATILPTPGTTDALCVNAAATATVTIVV